MATLRFAACVCLLTLTLQSAAAEPIAHGRPLSYWLLLLRERELTADYRGDWHSSIGSGPARMSAALRALGPNARTAVPALLAWFCEGSESADGYRVKALYLAAALRDTECADPSLAPLLTGLAAHGADELSAAALQALERIGPEQHRVLSRQRRQTDAVLLLPRLHDDSRRFEAAESLARLDPEQARAALPFLTEAMIDPAAAMSPKFGSFAAAPVLQQMGPAAREVTPLLEYRFRQEGHAAFAAALVSIAPEKGIPLVRAQPAAFRKEVMRRLAGTANLQPAVAPLFADSLDDRGLFLDAAAILQRLDPIRARAAAPRFAAELDDLDPEIQLRAAAALVKLDPAHNKKAAATVRFVLQNFDGPTRERARDLLLTLDKEAVPALTDLLADPRWWYVSLEELPRFGADASPAIPALKKLLEHQDRNRAVRAAWALACIDAASVKPAIPMLLDAVKHENLLVRELALLSLGKIAGEDRRAVAALVSKVGKPADSITVIAAVHGLRMLGKDGVPLLVECLTDADLTTRCNAAWVLAEVAPDANAALPALRKLLADAEPFARLRAAYALGRIDRQQPLDEIEKVLLPLMERGDRTGREAALALGRLARQRNLMPAILRALRIRPVNEVVRANAAIALRAAGSTAPNHLAVILPALKDALAADRIVGDAASQRWQQARRRSLLRIAAELGPEARTAIPAVLASWKYEELRDEVALALTSLGPADPKAASQVAETVREAVAGTDASREFDMLDRVLSPADAVLGRVLASVWPEKGLHSQSSFAQPRPRDVALVYRAGKEIIPELVKLLSHRDAGVRHAAVHALWLAGEAGKPAAPHLVKLMKEDTKSEIHTAAVVALWGIRRAGIADGDLLPALNGMLASPNYIHRQWATQRLGEFGAAATAAIPSLIKLLEDRQREVKIAALESLGKLGASDKTVIAALEPLLRDKDSAIFPPLLELLLRIGPPAKDLLGEACKLHSRETRHWRSPNSAHLRNLTVAMLRTDPKPAKMMIQMMTRDAKADPDGVLEALGEFGPEVNFAVPALIQAYRTSKRNTPEYRKAILKALSAIGPDSKETIPGLVLSARGDPDSAALLGAFGAKSEAAVSALTDGLKAHAKEFNETRAWKGASYADALAAIGPAARATVPDLLKLHEQARTQPIVYLRVAAAIKRIDPDAAKKAGIP